MTPTVGWVTAGCCASGSTQRSPRTARWPPRLRSTAVRGSSPGSRVQALRGTRGGQRLDPGYEDTIQVEPTTRLRCDVGSCRRVPGTTRRLPPDRRAEPGDPGAESPPFPRCDPPRHRDAPPRRCSGGGCRRGRAEGARPARSRDDAVRRQAGSETRPAHRSSRAGGRPGWHAPPHRGCRTRTRPPRAIAARRRSFDRTGPAARWWCGPSPPGHRSQPSTVARRAVVRSAAARLRRSAMRASTGHT